MLFLIFQVSNLCAKRALALYPRPESSHHAFNLLYFNAVTLILGIMPEMTNLGKHD